MKRPRASKQPTMQTIADKAGLCRATVCMALRNDPLIAQATRARVQAIAKELGYRPNPLVSALMSQLRMSYPGTGRANIGLLHSSPTSREIWGQHVVAMMDGARTRAMELGYATDDIWLRDPSIGPDRLRKILDARGIAGILVLPHPDTGAVLEIDIAHFAAATCGQTFVKPALHRATINGFTSCLNALEIASSRGYRRCGIVFGRKTYHSLNDLYSGAYHVYQTRIPESDRIPPLSIDAADLEEMYRPKLSEDKRSFFSWMKEYSPELVISTMPWLPQWLQEGGWTVPGKVAYVSLGLAPGERKLTGMWHVYGSVGSAAIDLIIGQINRNEFGVPSMPKSVMLDSEWKEGKTILPHAPTPQKAPKPGRHQGFSG